MTLQDFFDVLAGNATAVFTFLISVPFSALLANYLSGPSAAGTPWKYLYSGLIYLACIPGIFVFTLVLYLFLFEKVSILDLDIIHHLLPMITMAATILIIKKKVNLDLIPGFGKITALLVMIMVVLIILWVLDRTRIWVITFLPLPFALLIFVVLLLFLLWGWRRFSGINLH
nr:hypothetical protein [Saprospiraceae bacterium]